MPKIPALPPLSEPVAQDDLIIIENTSTGDTEQAEVSDLIAPTLREVHYYKSSTTWTRPAGLTANPNGFVIVTCQGGGGGGGGVGTASGLGTSGGGGSGERAIRKIPAASLSASHAVTVGAGATGGVGNNAAADNTGGTSSFNALLTALGGGTAAGSTGTTTTRPGGTPGTGGANADLSFGGYVGQNAQPGGAGSGGGPGAGVGQNGTGNGAAAAANSGAGGAGALDNATTSRNGGAGGSGYVIVEVYY